MRFGSILFLQSEERLAAEGALQPEFFSDLNLDQIVDAVTQGLDEYNLKPFFRSPLASEDALGYRHEVFRDLESGYLDGHVRSFAQRMRDIRAALAQANKLYYPLEKDAWFLDTVEAYGEAIRTFTTDLASQDLASRGFRAFRDFLTGYAAGSRFIELMEEARALRRELGQVRYTVLIKDNSFTVDACAGEADYSAEISRSFAKFQQGAATDYLVNFRTRVEMNHIEAQIAEFVAKLNPALFARLQEFRARRGDFIDSTVAAFGREIHFYMAYIDHVATLQNETLSFCFPRMSASKDVFAHDAFDLALAQKLHAAGESVVCNDFVLRGDERIIVISGPNQGGKTTFARMFGQLHYLAALGCPVPGRDAQLFLFDGLFTHFEREEKVENLRGKLEDDLTRIHAILQRATSRSLVVLNEVFTSTTLQDETYLSRRIMAKLIERGVLGAWVTFVEELASFDEHVVSMVSTIVQATPALRTFKVVRQRADGLAYAMVIAERYGLSYARIKERISDSARAPFSSRG